MVPTPWHLEKVKLWRKISGCQELGQEGRDEQAEPREGAFGQ